MSFGRVVKALEPALRERVEVDIAAFLARHHAPEGIALDAAAWLVTAYRA
jgi:hypothetical protein